MTLRASVTAQRPSVYVMMQPCRVAIMEILWHARDPSNTFLAIMELKIGAI